MGIFVRGVSDPWVVEFIRREGFGKLVMVCDILLNWKESGDDHQGRRHTGKFLCLIWLERARWCTG